MCECIKKDILPIVNIQDIARYTILRLIQNGNSICPLKLQKVLYYMQAWHMVYFNKDNTLFEDIPEAWVNGPVYRVVYDVYKHIPMYDQIRLVDIGIKSTEADYAQILLEKCETLHNKLSLTVEQNAFIESIYKHYGSMSHDSLVYLTHSQKPWNKARKGLDAFEYTDEKIDLNDMYEYYKELKDNA